MKLKQIEFIAPKVVELVEKDIPKLNSEDVLVKTEYTSF